MLRASLARKLPVVCSHPAHMVRYPVECDVPVRVDLGNGDKVAGPSLRDVQGLPA